MDYETEKDQVYPSTMRNSLNYPPFEYPSIPTLTVIQLLKRTPDTKGGDTNRPGIQKKINICMIFHFMGQGCK